jgi:hypothetical protein
MVDTVEGGTEVDLAAHKGEAQKDSRYSVSRKGMGGRKPKYTEEFLKNMVDTKVNDGVSIKKQCREAGLPYISIYMAMKRVGLINPRKSAVVKTDSAPQVAVMPDVNPQP